MLDQIQALAGITGLGGAISLQSFIGTVRFRDIRIEDATKPIATPKKKGLRTRPSTKKKADATAPASARSSTAAT